MVFPLAQRIAATLSFSASQWREDGQLLAALGAPVRLRFDHSFRKPDHVDPLLDALAELLRTPYTTDHWPESVPIVWAGRGASADAHILLLEHWVHDHPYLGYEARFPHSEAVFRGAFSIG